jgi:hypothetical protein
LISNLLSQKHFPVLVLVSPRNPLHRRNKFDPTGGVITNGV